VVLTTQQQQRCYLVVSSIDRVKEESVAVSCRVTSEIGQKDRG
jgi:hypothetical protein